MQLVSTTLRRLVAATLAAFALHAPVHACNCVPFANDSGSFLHLNKDARIALPENALGVLYSKQPEHKIRTRDASGNEVLTETPPKLKARDFVIRDLQTGRVVKTRLTRLDIDTQLGEKTRSYYLLRKGAMGADEPSVTDDVRVLAEKHGLRDISAAVRDASGLFRIAPATGFIAGRTYAITAALDDDEDAADKAEVTIGPKLAITENDRFTLLAPTLPERELLDVAHPASCKSKRAAIVQPLRYAMPPQREAYRHLLATFTQQQFFGADLKRFNAPARMFVENNYRAGLCAEAAPFGSSELGQDKDLVYASCNKVGVAPERRQVRGFAGMLELEDKLHETPTIDIAFDKATGPGCWRLRLVEDGGSATGLRGWLSE